MMFTNEQVIDIAKKHGLKIQAESLKSNESGLDFRVVFAKDLEGENWVLRFPRREDVLPNAEKEKQILDLIEPRISVQTPVRSEERRVGKECSSKERAVRCRETKCM